MKRFSFLLFLFFCINNLYAQKDTSRSRLFFSSGIGPVYSFFAKGDPPFENNAGQYSAADKKFGRAIDFEIGYQLTKKTSLSVRFSDHKYSRSLKLDYVIRNTNYLYTVQSNLYSHQYHWQFLVNKVFVQKKNYSFGGGIGLFLFNDKGQNFSGVSLIPATGPSEPRLLVSLVEYDEWELGAPVCLFYEKYLSDNISFGARMQVNFLISAPDLNAMSLMPYFRINF